MDPSPKFCSHVLALSFNEKGKSFNPDGVHATI
jgi:hypothetical protein